MKTLLAILILTSATVAGNVLIKRVLAGLPPPTPIAQAGYDLCRGYDPARLLRLEKVNPWTRKPTPDLKP